MAKLITDPIGSFTQAAVTTINTNFDRVEAALENTLSRDGTTPNQMTTDFDMNLNDILNVDNVNANVVQTDALYIGPSLIIPSAVEAISPTELLNVIKTVDGAGSGLDADLLDGLHESSFVKYTDTSTATMGFVVDEDNMVSNSATKVPTQQSVKAYVDSSAVELTFASIASLRLFSAATSATTATVSGWNAGSLEGGGIFILDAADVVSSDNSVSIIVDAASRRWKRLLQGPADFYMGGALPGTGTDQGAKIQAVLDVYKHVRGKPGVWSVSITRVTGPDSTYALALNDYQKLDLDPNCEIRALGSTQTQYSMIYILGKTGVTIRGGILTGERDTHTGSTGEHGFVIDLRGTTNVRIVGCDISKGWGDGIYLGISLDASGLQPNIDTHILDCFVHNNRRNNISVTHSRRTIISNCAIELANGTSPQQGIDIEPNSTNTVFDVVVSNNTFTGNVNAAVRVEGTNSRVQMVTITGNTSRGDCTGALSTEAAIIAKDCDYVTIGNNTINTSGALGILCEDTDGCIVDNNVVNAAAFDGIKMLRCDNYQVHNNRIVSASFSSSGVYASIFISGVFTSSLGGIISNNIGTGVTQKYGVLIGSDASNNETIINNRMTGSTKKYEVNGKTGRVSGNDDRALFLGAGGAAARDVTGVDYMEATATTTAITSLNNGYVGQEINIRGASGFVLTHDGARIRLKGAVNWVPGSANEMITLCCISGGAAAIYTQILG